MLLTGRGFGGWRGQKTHTYTQTHTHTHKHTHTHAHKHTHNLIECLVMRCKHALAIAPSRLNLHGFCLAFLFTFHWQGRPYTIDDNKIDFLFKPKGLGSVKPRM